MMTLKLRLILIAVAILALYALVKHAKKKMQNLRYMLPWFLMDAALLLVAIFPAILTQWAELLGIYNPVNMVLFLGLLLALIIIYIQTAAIAKQADEIRQLAQAIALMNDSEERTVDTKKD